MSIRFLCALLFAALLFLTGCAQSLHLTGTRTNIHGFGEHATISSNLFPEQRQIVDLGPDRQALLIEEGEVVLVLLYPTSGPSLKSTADHTLQAYLFRPVAPDYGHFLSTYDDRLRAAAAFTRALPQGDPRAYAMEGTADLSVHPPTIRAVVHLQCPGPIPPYAEYATARPDLNHPRPPGVIDPPLVPTVGPATLDVTFSEYPAPSLMVWAGIPGAIILSPFLIFSGGRVPMAPG